MLVALILPPVCIIFIKKTCYMKKHFVLKLISPRPTFPQDITQEETAIMQQHAQYWHGLMEKGFVLVFGPVLDPKGVYGLAVVEAENEAQVQSFIAGDPALAIGHYEVCPILAVVPNKGN
jgi:uncharacterized protein YciI